jgi:hypothetical protein
MLKVLACALVIAAASPAFADDGKCQVTKVNDKETKLEVTDAWKKGDNWAETNCRAEAKELVFKWVTDNKACEGKNAIRYVIWFGKKGAEKKIESTSLCKDVGAAKPEPPKNEPAPTGDGVKCLITKIGGKDEKIEVSMGDKARWAEYDCRTNGEKRALQWAKDNKSCAGKEYAVKWSMSMGKPGAEKKWDGATLCTKVNGK